MNLLPYLNILKLNMINVNYIIHYILIKNYDYLYKNSNYNKIFSLKTNYYIVYLTDIISKIKIYRVYRLVALLFVKNKNYKNLKCISVKENMLNISKNNKNYNIISL